MTGTVNASGLNLSVPNWNFTTTGGIVVNSAANNTVQFFSGNAATGDSGSMYYRTGTATLGGSGILIMGTGTASGTGSGGITLSSGGGVTSTGSIAIQTGNASAGPTGSLSLYVGQASGGNGGKWLARAGQSNLAGGTAGNVEIVAGNALTATTTPGNVYVDAGFQTSGTDGQVLIGTNTNPSGGGTSGVTVGSNTVKANIPVVVGTYLYANSSSGAQTVPNSTAPATIILNGGIQNGISYNFSSGDFTVPATGQYEVDLNGVWRITVLATTTWWIAFDIYNFTAGSAVTTISCFQPRATTGNMTAFALQDSYQVGFTGVLNFTAGSIYRLRCYNNTTSGTAATIAFEPTLTNAATSRPGRLLRLNMRRVN